MNWLADSYHRLNDQWSHHLTTGLGLGFLTQAADLGMKALGAVAILAGLYFSYMKDQRDRELHAARLRGEVAPLKVHP